MLLLLLHILLGYKILHTSCLLPCELLNHALRIRLSLLRLHCYIAFPCEVRLCNYLLAFSTHCVSMYWLGHYSNYISPIGSDAILSDHYHNLLPTAILLTVPFGIA